MRIDDDDGDRCRGQSKAQQAMCFYKYRYIVNPDDVALTGPDTVSLPARLCTAYEMHIRSKGGREGGNGSAEGIGRLDGSRGVDSM